MPGPRYFDWFRLRTNSDRPDLLKLGQKMLGYLLGQRKLGGPPTMAVFRTLADGSTIRARFIDGYPVLEIVAAPVGGEPPVDDKLQGFVLTPGGTDENAYLETVLGTKPGGGPWRAVFFDESKTPVEYPGQHLKYSTTAAGKPFLDAPEGLQYSGNVDWRNTTETMHVTWQGSSARYFNDGAYTRDRFVYYKGAKLFDVLELPTEAPDPPRDLSTATVNGACLRKHEGRLWLIVVLRSGRVPDFPGGTPRYDTVYAVPLAVATGYHQADLPIEQIPRLQALYAEARFLADLAIEEDTYEYGHPWCFNQSGTEARTMRPAFYTVVREMILQFDEDLTEGIFSQTTHPWRTTTQTVTTSAVYTPFRLVGTHQHLVAGVPGEPDEDAVLVNGGLNSIRAFNINTSADEEYQLEFITELDSVDETTTDGAMKVAVDFVDNTPVYAYWLGPDKRDTFHGEHTHEQANSSEITAYDVHTLEPGGFENRAFSAHYEGNYFERADWTSTRLIEGHDGGLQLPWKTYTKVLGGESNTLGYVQRRLAWSWSDESPPTEPQEPPYLISSAATHYAGYTREIGASVNNYQESTSDGYHEAYYCDLRYQWLVYQRRIDSTVTTNYGASFYTDSEPAPSMPTTSGLDGADEGHIRGALTTVETNTYVHYYDSPTTPPLLSFGAQNVNEESSAERRLVVELGGVVLAEATVSLVTDSDSSTPPFTYRDRIGTWFRIGTFGSRQILTRSADDYLALPEGYDTLVETVVPDDNVADYMYSAQLSVGSWQTYRGKYCYSMLTEAPSYLQGLGAVVNGTPDTPPGEVIGYPLENVLYPISILPPTALR